MERKDLKIVFFGTPEFAVCSLDSLIKSGFNVAAVVTMPDKRSGRGNHMNQSDVKKYAVDHGLEVLQPEKLRDPEFVARLREINADLFIVIAFRMLPEVVWGMPRLGTFNLHASLLPKYRGAAPINRAIMNGETETGITTFFLKHEIDTGDMIDQVRVDISADDDAGTVHDRLMLLGARLVVKTVDSIISGSLVTTPQPDGEFIPAPKIFKNDCKILWNQNSQQIYNLVRGLSPYPAAFSTMTFADGSALDAKIYKVSVVEEYSKSAAPGEIIADKRRLLVNTADGVLEILSLQPAGKKRMDASAFLLGYHPEKFV